MPRNTTTSIRRPVRAASDAKRSRLGDLTRPIPLERRVSRRPRLALFAALGAAVVIAAAAFVVFVLPVNTWRDQGVDLERTGAQLREIDRVNSEVAAEVNRLRTDDGIREAAREDYGFVEVGEERSSILPMPPLPTDLPDGFPYSPVTRIIEAVERGPAPPPPDPGDR